MTRHNPTAILLAALTLFVGTAVAGADVFNLPAGQKSLELVAVGDAGNAAHDIFVPALGQFVDRCGPVAYAYQIGKYEVTAAQYCEFLNAVAQTDAYGLYDSRMAPGLGANCGITQTGSPGSYEYALTAGRENFPVNCISWGDAARFCNWLENDQPIGAQGPGTTETGAYALNGANSNATLSHLLRSASAQFWIPSYDEWYKAAYYKGGGASAGYWAYPTQSDAVPGNSLPDSGNHANFKELFGPVTDQTNLLTPVGTFSLTPGPYGTFDQAGNVYEWFDTTDVLLPSGVGMTKFPELIGGGYGVPSSLFCATGSVDTLECDLSQGLVSSGFRIAAVQNVPEPSGVLLLLSGAALLFVRGLRRRNARHAGQG